MKKRLLLCTFLLLMGYSLAGRAACSISPTSVNVSLGTVTSFVLNTTPQTASTTITVNCGSGVVVLLSSDFISVQLASATPNAGGRGQLALSSNNIPIQLCSTSNCSTELTIGGAATTYSQTQLINLANLLGGFVFPIPFYIRTLPNAVVPAGTYTGQLSVLFTYRICTGIGLFGICLLGQQQTGTFTVPITVTITITNDCTTITAPAINFGSAPLVGSFLPVNQSISVVCTVGSTYTVGLNNGLHATGNQRYMASGSNLLAYQIYQGSGSTYWGSIGTARVSSSASNSISSDQLTRTFNYNALILTSQNTPVAGSYSDTVTVDLSF
ncbi:Csu type fimbrial protein [Erwinia pyrifoliae]|uniref:Csu type fimbrial protein n=1 Tax=Erwinia pyrifoliae TaxID=79967 RepID=UPI0021FA5B73|nr:spore coat U domain-containing protein [Erwinia pyrifoliae]MCT2385963.1 spore coat U domain-containing protein [Erwinia pyrifoliae]MCU8588450.1 spore coat U domain-containing protein [Erwinia pyrifoliae]UWS29809.1 spore coat U domain-containing protein [Erwinia pyrifoliae]